MALFLSSDMGEDDKAVVVNKILILRHREWLKSDSFSGGRVGESFLFVDRIRLSADRIRLSTGAIRMPTDSLIVATHSFGLKKGKYAPKFQRKGENGEFNGKNEAFLYFGRRKFLRKIPIFQRY